jgi:hypothetical protein
VGVVFSGALGLLVCWPCLPSSPFKMTLYFSLPSNAIGPCPVCAKKKKKQTNKLNNVLFINSFYIYFNRISFASFIFENMCGILI